MHINLLGQEKMSGSTNLSIPLFKYQLSSPNIATNGWISLGGVSYHHINNFDEFYAALGYTNTHHRSGVPIEEFIWERYTRDGARKNRQCLQTQITNYLYKNSEKFSAEYGQAHQQLINICTAECFDSSDNQCVACKRHPASRQAASLDDT
jgi:hypothetical protein